MDSLLDDSVFDDSGGAASDFEPVAPVQKKAKAKAAPKAAAKPKKIAAPKAASKKTTQTTLKPKAKAVSKKRAKPDSDDEDEEPDVTMDSLNDDSILSTTPPSAKKQKTAATKKTGGKPLAAVRNEAISFDGSDEPPKAKAGGQSEKYQKLTQLEHIIKRPDTYIGSVERNDKQMWVYNTEKEAMEFREVSFVPGLYKIFDEILVNAADNKQNDKNMDTIKVTMDREKGEISVWNNGRGIPIQIHDKEKIYIPEMIFGHLLTSSNYDDDQQKVTGGRNGYGAKLCNVFSTKFTIETADARSKQKYKQTWTKNMSQMGPAAITPQKGDDFTKVTFSPDFAKFGMEGIDDDLEALIKRRVYDMAGTSKGVKVYLNGERIKIKNFKDYMEMFTKAIKKERGEEAVNDKSDIVIDGDKERWEIGFAVSDGTFQQVSFVNSIATTSGGTHTNFIADQICARLVDVVKKRNKGGATLKPAQIRNHIFLFINCQIVNPAFTSQTKEQLTTKASQFGSKFSVSDKFIKDIQNKTEVITNILAFADKKADQILKKSDGSKRSRMDNPKLTDANKAGTREGEHCTLILTEGDSAKGLAMTGRSVVSPDLFGVFPLRGKLLNVRDASIDQISKNAEIQNIKNILGLKHKQVYTDCKNMRYGHIMIMTDQDHDGSHIKGLLINFLQVQYPSLLKIPQFLIEFITPIVKVYKGPPNKPTKSQSFFTMPEYESWKEAHMHERGWEVKYYKGLGTSTDEDAERYFRDLDKHLKEFHAMQDHEPDLIELAFSKKKADERKEWLRQFKPGTYLDHSTKSITYENFVNRELILFSMADNLRSIPSVIDGFKPGQRKVLYACLKRNLKKDMKVVELAGNVMGVTAYHHGEASLQQTIVGLAQNFVGSNNINTLEPSGNFGSRLQGGSDSASARYIFTRLSPFARRVFHPHDDPLLKHNTDDGKTIEPEMYVPVVPMILVNGADGIGTGWSSSIPNYNPCDIVDNIRRMMKGEEPVTMTPWFRDFEGKVEQTAPDRYKFSGVIKQTKDTEVEITELPIRMWTQDYKDKIVDIIKAEKGPSWIKDYDDYNTKQKVNFVIRLDEKHLKAAIEEGLEEKFKLTKTMATSNLVAFDAQGRITKYANVEEILKAFFEIRIKFYEKRKAYQLTELNKELEKLSNQARFVQMIIDGKLVVSKKKKKDLVAELKQKNFKPFPKVADAAKEGETEPAMEDEDVDEDANLALEANSYDYLLGMAIWSLTKERYEKLLKQMGDKELDIDTLIKLSKEDLWNKDLDEFVQEWEYQLADEKERAKKVRRLGVRGSSKLKTQVGATKKRKGGDDSDSDFATKKSKKNDPKGGIQSILGAVKPAPKAAPKKTQTKLTELKKPVAKAPSSSFDGIDDSDLQIVAKSKAPAPSKVPKPEPEDSDEEVIKPKAKRAGRGKPVKYSARSDSDSDDDDVDFDVSRMVKGIGETTTTTTVPLARPLFASSAGLSRPGSSAGIIARKSLGRERPILDDDSADETDYTRLAPASNAGKKAPTAKEATVISDDDEDAMDIDAPVPAPVPATKKKGRATGAATKEKAEKPAKTVKAKAPPKAKKEAPLSAAAKAYASKKAKPSAHKVDSDEESDADRLANELLDDDEEDDSIGPAAAARPSRKAATQTKKAWMISDDSEDDFGMDDDSD